MSLQASEWGKAKKVGMYVCGPTVYNRPHIGNARAVVVYDVLFRLLKQIYGEEHVTYVRNITFKTNCNIFFICTKLFCFKIIFNQLTYFEFPVSRVYM